MAAVDRYPTVVPDAYWYGRQRGVAAYCAAPAAGAAHIWGHRGRVLVAGYTLHAQRGVGLYISPSYRTIARVSHPMSAIGSSGRRLTLSVLANCAELAVAQVEVGEAGSSSGSATQELDEAGPVMTDARRFGLDPFELNNLERSYQNADFIGSNASRVDRYGLGVFTWTWTPDSGLSGRYVANIKMKEATTEGMVRRLLAVTLAETVEHTTE